MAAPRDRQIPRLWLLSFKNPLRERLGEAFFAAIPNVPGVYRLANERGETVYIGKAKRLRDRLRSYTYANPENASRKVLRMVYLVRSITWEKLASEKAALLRENQLLRAERPFFNVLNTSPETYLFVHLREEKKGLRIHLAMTRDESYPDVYGAFKGLGVSYRAHKALLRLMWIAFHECRYGFELPGNLTSRKKLAHYLFLLPPDRALYSSLRRYFNGTSKTLLERLIREILSREGMPRFMAALIQSDLDAALEFYERCARRNQRIKRTLGLKTPLLAQDELDDYLVLTSPLFAEKPQKTK